MKTDELFRSIPANIHELRLALAGLPKEMKVKADSETGVSEKTVDELYCADKLAAGYGGNGATQAQAEISGQDK